MAVNVTPQLDHLLYRDLAQGNAERIDTGAVFDAVRCRDCAAGPSDICQRDLTIAVRNALDTAYVGEA